MIIVTDFVSTHLCMRLDVYGLYTAIKQALLTSSMRAVVFSDSVAWYFNSISSNKYSSSLSYGWQCRISDVDVLSTEASLKNLKTSWRGFSKSLAGGTTKRK